ncbi:hypothetical protein BGZ76_005967 [Entomortierella beljakovae]|nr:hypothetical protein BGZ76_005967 [Entomortierella beljakovae]
MSNANAAASASFEGDSLSSSPARNTYSQSSTLNSSTSRSSPTTSTPWRSTSQGRNSPALTHSSTFKETGDYASGNNQGMTSQRGNGPTSYSERQRIQPSVPNSMTSSSNGMWTSQNKRSPYHTSGPTSSSNTPYYSDRNNTSEQHYNSQAPAASPTLGSASNFSRSPSSAAPAFSTSPLASIPVIVADSSPISNAQKQPLNLEALAAKFADSKETKEKFAKLQLSPALSPTNLADKERRAPMGAFGAPSSGSSNFASIKVQRTASLNQSSHNTMLSKGLELHLPQASGNYSSGNRLQPGLLAQSTDMRRTASHNNAFSTGLGMPIGNSGQEHISSTNNNHSNQLASGPHLTPFSLSQLARPTRRSSLNPLDQSSQYEQASSEKTSHPLQHSWTLYYDIATGFNRQGSSLHHYENGLRKIGMFTTVEMFARYFNWIEKPHSMENSANFHLFKDGIKPMWEDPANANGGRWIVTLLNKNPELLDRCWMELAYALVGEQLDAGDDICGAVLSRRTKADRLAVWVRDKDNVAAINGIGKRLIQMLDLSKERISLEFQITTDSRNYGPPRAYITFEAIKKELARDSLSGDAAPQSTEAGATPSLSSDSGSTPASAATQSPVTPYSAGLGSQKLRDLSNDAIGASGLLISVEGSQGIF